MTLLEAALEKYQQAIGRELTEVERKYFEAGWSACVVEHRKAEECEAEKEWK